ncbi:MAG: TolC family protein, partial [Planctomycetota bacterium]
LGITNQLAEILRSLEPVVQGRVRAGSGQEDLLRLQVEIGRLEDDLASLERRRPLASSRLARAMNDPALGLLPLPRLEEPELQAFDPQELLARALESSPELRSLEAEYSARRAGEEVASLHRRPNFTLAVDYLETGDALAPGTSGSGDDPILLGLTVSLPVWTSSYSAREREARQSVLAMDKRIEAASAALRVAIEEQSFRMDDASRRFSLYRESLIPRANEALELTLSSYRNGAASVLDLIDSERALLEFQLSFWRACRDHAQGFAELRRIVGGEL